MIVSWVMACSSAVPPGPTPAVVDLDGTVQFEPVGDEDGYRVAVPLGWRAERLAEGRAFVLDGARFHGGSLTISVRQRPSPGSDPLTALSAIAPEGATGLLEGYPLEAPAFVEAARAFPVQATRACPERWVVEGLALDQGQAYLVRVAPDAPGRCDARRLIDTQPVLETFALVGD
jgi:hypothetical protein